VLLGALHLPLFVVLSNLVSNGTALLPLIWAWALAGRVLRRADNHPQKTSSTLPVHSG
jgi:hypothetical protein